MPGVAFRPLLVPGPVGRVRIDVMPTVEHTLHTARVLRVREDACEVRDDERTVPVPFATVFPTPRTERVSPGHLVAIATSHTGEQVVVWRWFDAVVLGQDDDGSVRLWEPAHGEVVARPRPSYRSVPPGSRAFASAGLPGADWWVAAHADDVELGDVDKLYTDNDLWPTVFAQVASG